MKNIVKFTGFIVALTLIIVGCSSPSNKNDTNQDSSNDVVELSYWVPFSGADGKYMENMVNEFNESQDNIQVNLMNNNWQNYYPKLKQSLISKSAPDVAVAHVSTLPELIPTNMLESIDNLASEANLDWSTYAKEQVNAVIHDDKHYAIPLDIHALIMFYNKEYLEDAGLLADDGSIEMEQSVEGFTEVLRTLKAELPKDVSPLVIGTNYETTFWTWYALLNQQGVNYIEDDKVMINSPESKKAMELLQTWLDEELMPNDIGANSYDIFKTQKAAITFTGVWATGDFESESSLDLAAVPFPQLYDQAATWGDSHTLIVPKQDDQKNQVAAVEFADWLTEHGEMWAKAGHVPTKPSVLETEEFNDMPYRADYAEVMDDVEYMPSTPKHSAVFDAILESLTEINSKQVTVDKGLEDAQKKVESLLKK